MYCSHCGAYIDTRIRQADGTVVCPGCGTRYRKKSAAKASDGQARRPGAPVPGSGNSAAPPPRRPAPAGRRRPPKKKGLTLILALISALLLAVAALAGFLWYRSSRQTMAEKDLAAIGAVNDKLEQMRSSAEYQQCDIDARLTIAKSTVYGLAADGYIDRDAILVDDENAVITYAYPNGVIACEMVGGFDDAFDGPAPEGAFLSPGLPGSAEYAEPAYFADAVILNAMTDRDMVMSWCRELQGDWSSRGLRTELNTSVTLDDLTRLDDYAFVYVKMHGTYREYPYRQSSGSGYEVGSGSFICLEQARDEATDRKYQADLLNRRVAYINGRYMVAPEFFEVHYPHGELDGSIFFFGCCELMGRDSQTYEGWTEALLGRSVAAFVGFHNINFTEYNLCLVQVFVSDLLSGGTAGEAFEDATLQHGANDIEWHIRTKGGVGKAPPTPGTPLFRGREGATLEGLGSAGESGLPAAAGAESLNEYILRVCAECAEDFIRRAADYHAEGDADGAVIEQLLSSYASQCSSFSLAGMFTGEGMRDADFFSDYTASFYTAEGYSIPLVSRLKPLLTDRRLLPCPEGWTDDVSVVLGSTDGSCFLWVSLIREGEQLRVSSALVGYLLQGESILRYEEIIDRYYSLGFIYDLRYLSPYGDWDRIGRFTNIRSLAPSPAEMRPASEGGEGSLSAEEAVAAVKAYALVTINRQFGESYDMSFLDDYFSYQLCSADANGQRVFFFTFLVYRTMADEVLVLPDGSVIPVSDSAADPYLGCFSFDVRRLSDPAEYAKFSSDPSYRYGGFDWD